MGHLPETRGQRWISFPMNRREPNKLYLKGTHSYKRKEWSFKREGGCGAWSWQVKLGGPRTKGGHHIFSNWRRIMGVGTVQLVGVEEARNRRSSCSIALVVGSFIEIFFLNITPITQVVSNEWTSQPLCCVFLVLPGRARLTCASGAESKFLGYQNGSSFTGFPLKLLFNWDSTKSH